MLIAVTLYLWGDRLDPQTVTEHLQLTASESHYKGQQDTTTTGKVVTKRTGMWSLSTGDDLPNASLDDHIKRLESKLKNSEMRLSTLYGLDDACIDVFLTGNRTDETGDAVCFELSAASLQFLNSVQLPLRFSVNFVS